MTIYAPTSIDLSRVPLPNAIEPLSHATLLAAFMARFQEVWDTERAIDPTLPVYDNGIVETDPVKAAGRAWNWLRLLDRQRVNDVIRSLLAPLAKGTNLDNVVARQNVQRLILVPATADTAAVMESDLSLLRRYLLSFDKAAAGSRDRYLYEAWTAWPEMLDARVNGFAVHGRRGDTDVVIIGPDGDLATVEQKASVSAAVLASHVKPEAVSVAVLDATRHEYAVDLVIEVPTGPDATLVKTEAISRVTKAAATRMMIGGEIPAGFLSGAAYGDSIIRVRDISPVVIEAEAYTVPVMVEINIVVEVRS